MNALVVAAFVCSGVALVAFGLVGWMFLKGRWLKLLVGAKACAEDADGKDAEGRHQMARRMAVVLLICFVLTATLIAFEAAKLTGNELFATVATWANNITFFALIIGMIWFFVVQRPSQGKDAAGSNEKTAARARSARLDHLPTATILFVIAVLAVIALIGILFAGVS